MKIAILGTGLMGSAFGEALLKAHHQLFVYNRTAAKTAPLVALGATATTTAAEAIRAAEASIIVLPDAASVRELLLSADTRAALKGRKLLNASTTKQAEIVALAGEVAALGGALAEVSILVGAEQLRDQQAQFLLGCAAADEALWKELLLGTGTLVHRAGEIGDASKAETPMLFASVLGVATAAYSVAVSLKLGLPKEIIERQLSLAIPGAEYLLPNLLNRNYDQCLASVENFQVVSTTALGTAKSLGLPLGLLQEVDHLFATMASRGFGPKDGTSILEALMEPGAGRK